MPYDPQRPAPREFDAGPPSWARKFAVAFRGIACGLRGENSFIVHGLATLAVIVAAAVLKADRTEWALLWLCIVGVVTCELFNSAIERLARAVDRNFNPDLRDALDISSGAVLCASLGAAVVGLFILGRLALAAM